MSIRNLFKENKIEVKPNRYATLTVSNDSAYGELTIINKGVTVDNVRELLKKLIDEAEVFKPP